MLLTDDCACLQNCDSVALQGGRPFVEKLVLVQRFGGLTWDSDFRFSKSGVVCSSTSTR